MREYLLEEGRTFSGWVRDEMKKYIKGKRKERESGK